MADRPILFSAPMVRALLAGTKMQTRRLAGVPSIEQQDNGLWHVFNKHGGLVNVEEAEIATAAADYLPIQPGDRLWVKERLQRATTDQDVAFVSYFADGSKPWWIGEGWHWRNASLPSIHMPKTYSRLTLHVTDARVQRLHEISEGDAVAEGCRVVRESCYVFEGTAYDKSGLCHSSPVTAYSILWDDINGDGSWEANPWVAAYTFTVEHANIDALPRSVQ